MKKHVFYKEIAYFCAIFFISMGVALAAKSDFGVSMIAAPTYTFHLWLSQYNDILTLGTIDYMFQGIVILLTGIITNKFRISYLFCFITAVFTGLMIDTCFFIVASVSADTVLARIFALFLSIVSCAFGVACIFKTYFAPAGHELFVKEFSIRFGKDMHKVKIAYDIFFCVLSIVLNLLLFKGFVGIGIGTIVTALLNGVLIGKISSLLDKHFEFKAALPKLEKYFEK